ncbi:hypothetical protein MCHI_001043 [Candidatus Magnetoovum chiemensis]|nr:hypothetical protein MCHI_001043 [Candidatus Magnetoovum chiemensis]
MIQKVKKEQREKMDTVNKVMVLIDDKEMEILKICLVKELIRKRCSMDNCYFLNTIV